MATSEELLARMEEYAANLEKAQQTVVEAAANASDTVHRTGDEEIAGTKIFKDSPQVPKSDSGDRSNNAANTEFVQKAIDNAQIGSEAAANIAKESRTTAENAAQTAENAAEKAEDAAADAQTALELSGNAVGIAEEANSSSMEAMSIAEKANANSVEAKNAAEGAHLSFAGMIGLWDMAGLFRHELEKTRFTRFQEITVKLQNRGVAQGVNITKSDDATRNLHCSAGRVFMNGREYSVRQQDNTASVPSNTGKATGYAIIYAFLENGRMDVGATTLNGELPEGALELARVFIPSGNTEANDPYIRNVTVEDTARREPGWPVIQKTPAQVYVPLNRELPDAGYIVHTDIVSCKGIDTCGVEVADKTASGFTLRHRGNADDMALRILVAHPAI